MFRCVYFLVSRVAFELFVLRVSIRWIDCDDEWNYHSWLFILLLFFVAAFPRTLDDSVNLRTFIIYFDVPEELEVKFDSCNSKMENNCFSDIFIGSETSAQHIIIVAPRFSIQFKIGIQIDKSNRRQKEMKKIARTWRQMLVLNGNGSNDAHSIWN